MANKRLVHIRLDNIAIHVHLPAICIFIAPSEFTYQGVYKLYAPHIPKRNQVQARISPRVAPSREAKCLGARTMDSENNTKQTTTSRRHILNTLKASNISENATCLIIRPLKSTNSIRLQRKATHMYLISQAQGGHLHLQLWVKVGDAEQ